MASGQQELGTKVCDVNYRLKISHLLKKYVASGSTYPKAYGEQDERRRDDSTRVYFIVRELLKSRTLIRKCVRSLSIFKVEQFFPDVTKV